MMNIQQLPRVRTSTEPWFAEAELPRVSYLGKRVFDVVVATLCLIILAPAFAAIAWGVRSNSPGPAFYTQLRNGKGRTPFRIYKFRTMVDDADERLHDVLHLNVHARAFGDARLYKIPNDPRITRFGTFLRKYSLDELPQLINVLKGEMSLVGPRPLMLIEDQHVEGSARLRATVKPGITGPWQILGRNEIPFEEMMQLDCLYVANWSLLGDLRILIRTVPAVCRSQRAV